MSIGATIRKLREKRDLSQVELSEKVHISQSMLCQIERGTKAPSLPLSQQLASVLQCTLEDLVSGDRSSFHSEAEGRPHGEV